MSRLVAVTPFIMTADLKHELLSFQQKQLDNAGEESTEKAILITVLRTHWPPPSSF